MDTRSEIREFLTTRRARITPDQVGLATYGPRRVPGLRCEEVAVLAGVSVPYYTLKGAKTRIPCANGVLAPFTLRNDGTRSRRYICRAHALKACKARPVDADIADHAIVAHLNALLGNIESQAPSRPSPGFPRERLRGDAEAYDTAAPVEVLAVQLKHRIADALRDDDTPTADALLAELVDHQLRFRESTNRPAQRDRGALPAAALDPLELLFEFYEWSAAALAGQPTDAEWTKRLNAMLRRWFDAIEMRQIRGGIEMLPRYAPTHAAAAPRRVFVHVGNWRVAMVGIGPGHRRGEPWTHQEILFALKTWAHEHGRAPHSSDWDAATSTHPHAQSVFNTLAPGQPRYAPRGCDQHRQPIGGDEPTSRYCATFAHGRVVTDALRAAPTGPPPPAITHTPRRCTSALEPGQRHSTRPASRRRQRHGPRRRKAHPRIRSTPLSSFQSGVMLEFGHLRLGYQPRARPT